MRETATELDPRAAALHAYLLHRGDTGLILGQRLSAWCGHGPVLEQDIALTNVALDLVGQARNYYQYAARLAADDDVSEDTYAYWRNDGDFTNPLLCEVDNGDWGRTLMRQFLHDQYHFPLLEALRESADEHLGAIAAKSLKEVAYHRRYSADWVVRLGDGTDESHARMQTALGELWRYTGELLTSAPVDLAAAEWGLAPKPETLAGEYDARVRAVLTKATLEVPDVPAVAMRTGGKSGRHSEALGFLLAELQHLHRSHPGATW